jgi:hypothetical protein
MTRRLARSRYWVTSVLSRSLGVARATCSLVWSGVGRRARGRAGSTRSRRPAPRRRQAAGRLLLTVARPPGLASGDPDGVRRGAADRLHDRRGDRGLGPPERQRGRRRAGRRRVRRRHGLRDPGVARSSGGRERRSRAACPTGATCHIRCSCCSATGWPATSRRSSAAPTACSGPGCRSSGAARATT